MMGFDPPPHEKPVETLPVDTSICPKTFSALRHSLAFSQALTTAPQVTSVDYGSAWWPGAGKPRQKWGFNHWKYGKRWISPFEMWI